jgi:hypothetical protein
VRATDHAWAAGIIDGEGCIAIKRSRGYFVLALTVGQSGHDEPAMLRRLVELYGGTVRRGTVDARPGRRRRWDWTVVGRQAEVVLRQVAPYVVAKREQLDLALEYRRVGLGRGRQGLAAFYFERIRAAKRR